MNPVEQTEHCPDCNSRPVILRALDDGSVQINQNVVQKGDLENLLGEIFSTRAERVLVTRRHQCRLSSVRRTDRHRSQACGLRGHAHAVR